jgi:DNA-binding transcriptional regulator YiaG
MEEYVFDEKGYIHTSTSKEIRYVINENGCHVCTSHHKKKREDIGITRNGKRSIITRYVWEIVNGKIPNGLLIRHKCDNPPCINPDHLELGTNQDNSNDKLERGRQAKGENQGSSKLTEDQVRDIKMNTTNSITELAEMYGVAIDTIQKIDQVKTWKHVVIDEKYNHRPNHLNIKKRKFSKDQIEFIRSCDLSNAELARMFNVKPPSIRDIRNYKNYKY